MTRKEMIKGILGSLELAESIAAQSASDRFVGMAFGLKLAGDLVRCFDSDAQPDQPA